MDTPSANPCLLPARASSSRVRPVGPKPDARRAVVRYLFIFFFFGVRISLINRSAEAELVGRGGIL